RTTAAERPSVRKLYNWANYLKLRREERAAWQQFDGITLTSERDERLLRHDAPEKPTAVIPNGVDTEFFRPSADPVEPGTIVLVPLRIGGGTRLKIVEAMAMGKPIVATRLGAEGIDVNDGEDILLGDTAEEFANQVARVLGDAGLAHRLGKAARHRAESQYT